MKIDTESNADPEDETAQIAAEATNLGVPDKSAYETGAAERPKNPPAKLSKDNSPRP